MVVTVGRVTGGVVGTVVGGVTGTVVVGASVVVVAGAVVVVVGTGARVVEVVVVASLVERTEWVPVPTRAQTNKAATILAIATPVPMSRMFRGVNFFIHLSCPIDPKKHSPH